MDKITGYKGFNKDFTCNGFQFEIGKDYEHKGKVEPCSSGFHFCEYPLDVWNYYGDIVNNKYAKIEASKTIKKEGNKSCTNNILIIKELTLSDLVKEQIELMKNFTNDKNTENNSGNYAKIANSGDSAKMANSGYSGQMANSDNSGQMANSGNYAKMANSGNSGQIANSGNYAKMANSGNYGQIANSGDYGQMANSSDYGQMANSGDSGQMANSGNYGQMANSDNSGQMANSGNYAKMANSGYCAKMANSGYCGKMESTGENSILAGIGIQNRVKAIKDNWIVLIDYQYLDDEWEIKEVYRAKVGKHKIKGVKIMPDIWYWLKDGILMQEK